MKLYLGVFVLFAGLNALAAPTKVDPKSENMAVETVTKMMSINFPNQEFVLSIQNETATGDETNTVETIVINGHTIDAHKNQSSADFYFTVEVLDGLVWSVNTKCPTCG